MEMCTSICSEQMDVHYRNTGTTQKPYYQNDIGANTVKQLLILLGYKADSFTVSLHNGLICVYMQQDVVFVKSLGEFYNTKIKTELTKIASNLSANSIHVLQNTLLLLSGNQAEPTALKDSILFLRLFVIPLMHSLKCDKMAEMILECGHCVLALSEGTQGYYDIEIGHHLSRSSLINLVRSLRAFKQQMDACALNYCIDKQDLERLHTELRVFSNCTDQSLEYIGTIIRRMCNIEPIRYEREAAELDQCLYIERDTKLAARGTKLVAHVKLYTTIALFRNAMVHYMGAVVSVINTQYLRAQTLREEISCMLQVTRTHGANVFEFVECCRPCNVIAMSMIENNSMLRWLLHSCYLKIRHRAIDDNACMTLIPYHWSICNGHTQTQSISERAVKITNHLLGELYWTKDLNSCSHFRFERVSDETGSNVYNIRLTNQHTLLTVQYYDNFYSRVTFQKTGMANEADSQWRVIPVFLDEMTSSVREGGFVVIVPLSYPHTTLIVRKSRYGHCLSLWTGDPGVEGYWKLSETDIQPDNTSTTR